MEQGPVRKKRLITDGAAGLITRVEELAYELKIEEVMTSDVKAVAPDVQMAEVLELLRQASISGAPVVSNGNWVPSSLLKAQGQIKTQSSKPMKRA